MKRFYARLMLLLAIFSGGYHRSNAQSTTFSYTGSIQTFTVPAGVSSINFTAMGAEGGVNSGLTAYAGGHGASITGTVPVTAGDVLDIIVGGQANSATIAAGGGGGTFVWDATTSTPLIVAGGGGGASSTQNGIDASLAVNGTNGGDGAVYPDAGSAGNGAPRPVSAVLTLSYGGGGAGWLTDGANGSTGGLAGTISYGGNDPAAGGAGGAYGSSSATTASSGGYGGGGGGEALAGASTSGSGGAGGGGGYSGGGAGAGAPVKSGGGGGSYCAGAITSSSATNTGNGLVIISIPCGPGAITGASPLCVGNTEPLTDTPSGGTWVSANTTIATIDASGNAWGVTTGTDTILYIVFSSCGIVDTVQTPLIILGTSAGAITGIASVCVGTTTMLSDAASGGSWSATNTNASISTSGIVTGSAAGLDTIMYTNPCSNASTSVVVTVNPVPVMGPITGTTSLCTTSSPVTLSATPAGGTWSSSNTLIATVTTGPPGGTVTAIAAGTAVISYSVAYACGTMITTTDVTVTAPPTVSGITGTTAMCTGTTYSLSATPTGGSWSSSNTAVALVSAGAVTPGIPGVATISYTVSNSCGSATATVNVTVSTPPAAGAISGASSVCIGATIPLTDAATSGVWSAFNTNASVSGSGVVTGVAAGTDVISYSVTNSCGTAAATQTVTIIGVPVVGAIAGASTICIGAPQTFSDATSGGTWSAGNTNASVSSGGLVTGVSAGADVITYTVTGICGNGTATFPITVSDTPTVSAITGIDSVCISHSVVLSDATAGGAWSAGNTNATVAGGTVTGAVAGYDTITYTVSNACGSADTTFSIKVNTACPTEVYNVANAEMVELYPNPAGDELIIKMSEGAYSSYVITNSLGQVIMQRTIRATETTVNLQGFAPAIYYITFRGENGSKAERFVKM